MADTAEHATVVTTVESTPQTRSKVESPFVYLPAPLFGQVTHQDDIRRLLAYALTHRAKFNDVPIDLPALMNDLHVHFGIDENLVFELAEQAENSLADFRVRHLEKSPSVAKVPWTYLVEAYRGDTDMSVDYFVVLCSVAACFPFASKRAKPLKISARRLLRLAHGFSTRDSFTTAVRNGLTLRTKLTERRVRFITRQLADAGHLVRVTCGGFRKQYVSKRGVKVNGRVGRQQTWYYPAWLPSNKLGADVETFVKSYATDRQASEDAAVAKAKKRNEQADVDVAVAMKRQRLLNECQEHYDRQAMLLEPMPTQERVAVDVLDVLRKAGKSVLTAEQAASHKANVCAEIHTPAGERLYLVQTVSTELANLLTSAGYTVKRYR